MFLHNLVNFGAKKCPFSLREEVTINRLFSSLPGRQEQLACFRAGIGTWRGRSKNFRRRLPWFHRASPSTTLNEIRYINEYG
jgi:hypothetical protein